MEPADLNSPADDRQLAELLHQDAAPVADDGFSDRVLAALPPPADARNVIVPLLAVLVGTAAGLLYARLEGGTWAGLSTAWRQLGDAAGGLAPAFDNPWLWLLAALVAASCYSALRLIRHPGWR